MGTGTRTVPEPVSPSTQLRLVSVSVDPFIPRPRKHQSSYPLDQIMSHINTGVQTRSKLRNSCAFYVFLSNIELKNVYEALVDSDSVTAMQEELHQFERNRAWHLEPKPKDRSIISTKWVFKNRLDEFRTVTWNKARLVVQGYNQEEGIDYEETFAPVALRLSFMVSSRVQFWSHRVCRWWLCWISSWQKRQPRYGYFYWTLFGLLVYKEIAYSCHVHSRSRVCSGCFLLCLISMDTATTQGLWCFHGMHSHILW